MNQIRRYHNRGHCILWCMMHLYRICPHRIWGHRILRIKIWEYRNRHHWIWRHRNWRHQTMRHHNMWYSALDLGGSEAAALEMFLTHYPCYLWNRTWGIKIHGIEFRVVHSGKKLNQFRGHWIRWGILQCGRIGLVGMEIGGIELCGIKLCGSRH